MDNNAKLSEKFKGSPYNEQDVRNYLELLDYHSIGTSKAIEEKGEKMAYRIHCMQVKSPRTVFIFVDNNDMVKGAYIDIGHKEKYGEWDIPTAVGCFAIIAVLAIIIAILWMIVSDVIDNINEPKDYDYDYYETDNKYDRNGDGKLDDVDGDGDVDYDDSEEYFNDVFDW